MPFAITGGRHEAEDLVPEALVRLVLVRPDLAAIEHLVHHSQAVIDD